MGNQCWWKGRAWGPRSGEGAELPGSGGAKGPARLREGGAGEGAGLPEAETANGQDSLRSGGWGPLGMEVWGIEREGLLRDPARGGV